MNIEAADSFGQLAQIAQTFCIRSKLLKYVYNCISPSKEAIWELENQSDPQGEPDEEKWIK